MIITKVLMSLPDSMKHFVSAWESTPAEKQTLTDLTLIETRTKISETVEQALMVKTEYTQVNESRSKEKMIY